MTFSLCIQPVIEILASELNIWYLNDGILGGEPKTILNNFKLSIQKFRKNFAHMLIHQNKSNWKRDIKQQQ